MAPILLTSALLLLGSSAPVSPEGSPHGGVIPNPKPSGTGEPGQPEPGPPGPRRPVPRPKLPTGPYTGPADRLRGRGPATPATPSGPGGPGTATPSGGRAPTTGAPGGTATAGLDLSDPEDGWDFWWAYNRERFLDLRRRIVQVRPHTASDEYFLGIANRAEDRLLPSREMIRAQIHPVLRRVLEQPERHQANEISSALIALARVQVDRERCTYLIARYLSHSSQEVRECAALALGILAAPAVVPMLVALAEDRETGRALSHRREVDLRTRAFATYALGVAGSRMPGRAHRLRRHLITEALLGLLARQRTADRELLVAAVSAIGIYEHPDSERWGRVVPALESVLDAHRGMPAVVRAQVPIALARLGALACAEAILERLADRREDAQVRQSLVIALGILGQGADESSAAPLVPALLAVLDDARSLQERYFAFMALGEIGSPAAVEALLQRLRRGKRLERPWAALALGVREFDRAESRRDTRVASALRAAMLRSRAPDYRAAFAIALGLAGDRSAAPTILLDLEETRIDRAAGHFSVGLALMRAEEACSRIKAMATDARHRPERLREQAIALGILGDRQVVPLLLELLADARTTTVRAAVAQALGRIGDARCVKPLIAQVQDARSTALARSTAIAALGLVGDPDALPWREALSRDVNYRAGSATLNDAGGVLDIL